MKAGGKETLALLFSIGLHAVVVLALAALLVPPAPLSGGIEIGLAGGSAGSRGGVTGKGRSGRVPPSASMHKHAERKTAAIHSSAIPKSKPRPAKTAPQAPPEPAQGRHRTVHRQPRAGYRLDKPEHRHRHAPPHRAALAHHRHRQAQPESMPHPHRQEHPPKTRVTAPAPKHNASPRHGASGHKEQKTAAKSHRPAKAKQVSHRHVMSESHSGGPGRVARTGGEPGSHHAGGAGQGGAKRHHGGGAGKASGKGSAAPNLRAYYAAILARIEAAKQYPWVAQRRRMQGKTRIAFRLSASGRLLSAHIVRSSGFAILDKAAMAAVRNAAPYPGFPGKKSAMPPSMAVNVDFVLK